LPRSPRKPRTPCVAHARHAIEGRVVSWTQCGKHARAQAQTRDKREEGKRDKARGTFSEEFSGGGRLKQSWSGAKMDAEAIVLRELKRGRNSDRLANALSLMTSLR
jgi:hypothetical protein